MKALWIINCIAIVYAKSPKFESCRTPEGKLGECKVITGCPHLLDLLQVQPLSYATMTFLKRSNCGFQGLNPKVCCDEDYEDDIEQPLENDYKPEKNIDSNLLPNKEDCGAATQNRIVGGEATDLDEFPWMVLLEYKKTYGRGFHCGGVLISKRYVLTAAHCVKGKDLPKNWDLVSVRLGEYNTETDIDCETQNRHTYCADKPVDVTITEKIVHEKYNSYDANQHHDLALLRLAEDVRFTSFIKPVCLPNVAEILQKDFSGINMTVAGWGKTESKSESKVKLKLQIPVKSVGDCTSVYSAKGITVGSGQLCAGGVEGKDSCRGDSGGPLMAEFFASGFYNWYVTGIVSFGPSPCGIEGWPGIYTKVTNYVPWIINHMRP